MQQSLTLLPDDDIVVLNGDTLFPVDLESMADTHRGGRARLTMALKQVANSCRFGRVEVSAGGVITNFLEKNSGSPGWINGGVYMVNRDLFTDFPMPKSFSFEKDLIEPNIERIRPVAFCSNAYFIDMGVPDDYERAQREVGRE